MFLFAGEYLGGGAGLMARDPAAGTTRDLRREPGVYTVVRTSPDGKTLALARRDEAPAIRCVLLLVPVGRRNRSA